MGKPFPDPVINQTYNLFTYTNTVTDGWMGTLFMIACASILFFVMKGKMYKTSQAAALAMTLTTFLGALLWLMGVLNVDKLMIFVAGTIGAVLWVLLDR